MKPDRTLELGTAMAADTLDLMDLLGVQDLDGIIRVLRSEWPPLLQYFIAELGKPEPGPFPIREFLTLLQARDS